MGRAENLQVFDCVLELMLRRPVMFDIGQFVDEVQIEQDCLQRTKLLLPESMLQTIQKYEASLALAEAGTPDFEGANGSKMLYHLPFSEGRLP
jgi:hypothetical protein